MKLRLATENDLGYLKDMYKKIVDNMNKNNINIWNEFYPCEVLQEDIEDKRFYVLENEGGIIASCALCNSNSGEDALVWKENTKNVLYIDRLGVNAQYLRQGVGGILLDKIKEMAKSKNIEYLRLFVVDTNTPAINLYLKNGFEKLEGLYIEQIDEDYALNEFGFEIKL